MSIKRTVLWMAGIGGMLAGASLAAHRRAERERRVSPATPEPLQTWESEGGAVPVSPARTAQQVTPSVTAGAGELGSQRPAAGRFEMDAGPDLPPDVTSH